MCLNDKLNKSKTPFSVCPHPHHTRPFVQGAQGGGGTGCLFHEHRNAKALRWEGGEAGCGEELTLLR